MSRQISEEKTLTSNTVSFDSDNSEYASMASGYPIENGIGDGSGTYAGFNMTTGSSAETIILYNFDCSAIPEDAEITSVACRARASTTSSSTSYINQARLQLYSGTTAKGSYTNALTTTATYFDLTAGSWTRNELQNAKIRFYGKRGTRSTSATYIMRFFGAVLTVEYTVMGTAYTITATSSVSGVTVDPATQEIFEGGSGVVAIYAESLDEIEVTDNGDDIKALLVQKAVDTGGTLTAAPSSYTTSGSISGTRYQSAIGHTVEDPASQTGNDYCSSSGSTATIYYKFDFSDIPENATIVSMSVQAIGHLESTSQAREVAELNTYHGTTAKGTQTEYTTTSNQIVTIAPGTWTRSELDDARVGFTIGYYGGLTVGITWSVTYTVPSSGNDYYYEYTISGIAADHVILVEEAGIFVPPDEDPEYTYYPVTISSINANTTPGTGTTRVQEGSNQTVTIKPSDPKLTLALDNGVDITSQLQGGTPVCTYEVEQPYTYGFSLNSNDYYESENKGVDRSAAVARVRFSLECECLVTFTYINYGEAGYDYGMFGNIDTALNNTGNTASSSSSEPGDDLSSYKYVCSASSDSTSSTRELTYNVPAGEHFIDVKYGKDQASDSGNDSLQFKVEIEPLGAGTYTYTLNDIGEKHSLIFVFGDVEYYFVTSSGENCKLYPDGQMIKLAGQSYHLTIVPDNVTAEVAITDNGIDKTSALVKEEGVSKTGSAIVNYIYKISNVNSAHNLIITIGGATIYIKTSGSWRSYRKVWKKISGNWVQQADIRIFDPDTKYVKAN